MNPIKTLALAATSLVWLAAAAEAHDTKAGDLMIDHPWARPNLPNRPTAAYAEIHNAGDASDRLLSASSPAFGRVELHTTRMDGDVMKMLRVEDITVPPGGKAVLEPGGLHIMLFDAETEFEEGARFPLILTFEKAGAVAVEVAVEKRGPKKDGHGDHGHDHGAGHSHSDGSGG